MSYDKHLQQILVPIVDLLKNAPSISSEQLENCWIAFGADLENDDAGGFVIDEVKDIFNDFLKELPVYLFILLDTENNIIDCNDKLFEIANKYVDIALNRYLSSPEDKKNNDDICNDIGYLMNIIMNHQTGYHQKLHSSDSKDCIDSEIFESIETDLWEMLCSLASKNYLTLCKDGYINEYGEYSADGWDEEEDEDADDEDDTENGHPRS